ncbi:MAG: hypothetical protein ACYDH4_13205, partial [Candidatus Cryosericum sp.]
MGTLNLAVTGLASNDPVPGSYIEVLFGQGESAGNPNTPRVLFIGPKTTAGSATPGSQVYQLGSVQDAITYFGTGSKVHRMMRRFVEQCKSALCYGIAPTESAGAAATGSVHFTTTSTGAGYIQFTLCGESIQTSVPKSTTVTAAATALKNDVNLMTHWPITATSSGATLKLAARTKGTDGNAIRYRATVSSGLGMSATAAAAAMSGGATDEVFTTACSTIEPDQYDYLVPGANVLLATSARVLALKAQVTTQAQPLTGIRQQIVIAHGGSQSTAVSFAAGTAVGNSPRVSIVWQENPEWEPMEIAAHVAGLRYAKEIANPVVNYDGYGKGVNDALNIPKQYSTADWPTRSEISAAISGGLSPI